MKNKHSHKPAGVQIDGHSNNLLLYVQLSRFYEPKSLNCQKAGNTDLFPLDYECLVKVNCRRPDDKTFPRSQLLAGITALQTLPRSNYIHGSAFDSWIYFAFVSIHLIIFSNQDKIALGPLETKKVISQVSKRIWCDWCSGGISKAQNVHGFFFFFLVLMRRRSK